ncbi:ferredoxin reductase [Mycolicibacterium sarraceniae]|uniref:Oxidoreductase n=1 Tax=Mycolicibacterium sarraceniae TaxID=1534348 RepID=A0A7I7SPB9_9MYCO|nr:FAD-binding oxidoreductase [Mycolicibacterium sarraceniae]BBY58603.1 oxidoreductase [Mycolicibacterium sarraceniae]
MFTQTLTKKVLRSPLVDLLTGPHGVDRYTELVDPTWTTDARAKVVDVRRMTPRSVTLLLAPNAAVVGHRAGQHLNLTVEIDGRRHTRCYSPASAEGASLVELTIGRHDGGVVSNHLFRHARVGMVVGLSERGGDFVLPDVRPRRILFISGGSGITPLMSMLRTLRAENFDGEIAFVHYARTPAEACYREELAAMGVRVLHGYTRSPGGELTGRFSPEHLQTAMVDADAVYVCGPPALVEAVRECCGEISSESFVPLPFVVPDAPSGGRITFRDSAIDATDDGRPLLDQAEDAGLNPTSGCRMGICHTCTRRKHRGAVRNLTTGAVSTADEEDVQICVSVPVGDVDIAL